MKAYGLWNSFLTITFTICQVGFGLGSNLWLSAWSNDSLDPHKALDSSLRDQRLGVYGGLGAGESNYFFFF